MSLDGKRVEGVKVLNINEESAEAIEKMVAKAIKEVRDRGMDIQEIQTTPDYLILVLIKAE